MEKTELKRIETVMANTLNKLMMQEVSLKLHNFEFVNKYVFITFKLGTVTFDDDITIKKLEEIAKNETSIEDYACQVLENGLEWLVVFAQRNYKSAKGEIGLFKSNRR